MTSGLETSLYEHLTRKPLDFPPGCLISTIYHFSVSPEQAYGFLRGTREKPSPSDEDFGSISCNGKGWNCGACGFNSCAEFNRYSRKNLSRGTTKVGPNCGWKVVDHGIACSFAAAAISALHIECRLQASYAIAAVLLGHLEGCNLGVGITVGPVKESAWFDRVDLKNSFTLAEHEQFVKDTLPQLFVAFCGSGHPQIKNRPDWAAEPRFWKESADPEFLAKQQEVRARVAKVVEREKAERAGK